MTPAAAKCSRIGAGRVTVEFETLRCCRHDDPCTSPGQQRLRRLVADAAASQHELDCAEASLKGGLLPVPRWELSCCRSCPSFGRAIALLKPPAPAHPHHVGTGGADPASASSERGGGQLPAPARQRSVRRHDVPGEHEHEHRAPRQVAVLRRNPGAADVPAQHPTGHVDSKPRHAARIAWTTSIAARASSREASRRPCGASRRLCARNCQGR